MGKVTAEIAKVLFFIFYEKPVLDEPGMEFFDKKP